MQSHLWFTAYLGPISHMKMALKEGQLRKYLSSSLFRKMSVFLLLPDTVLNQHLQLDDSETSLGLISFKPWREKHGLFSHGTWDISCASNVPQPKARELGFHSPTSTPLSSCNYTQLVSPSPCIISPKDKRKLTLEAKDNKAQENATSDHV